jgi:hypothetical protein
MADDGAQVGRIRTKEKLFGGKKTTREALDSGFSGEEQAALGAVQDLFDGVRDNIVAGVDSLGEFFDQDLSGRFADTFTANFDISGTGEEFTQAVAEWVQTTSAEAMSTAIGLIDPATIDTAYERLVLETLQAANGNLDAVLPYLNALAGIRDSFVTLNVDTELLTANMIDAAGGMAQLQASLSTYYQEFYSEGERQAALVSDAQATAASMFEELSMAVPQTREQFRTLVESLRATDDGADSALGSLLSMSGTMDTIFDDLEGGAKRVAESTSRVADSAMRAAHSGDFVQEVFHGVEGTSKVLTNGQIELGREEEKLANETKRLKEEWEKFTGSFADFKGQIGHDYMGVPTLADGLEDLARNAGMGSAEAAKFISSLSPEQFADYAKKFGVSKDALLSASGVALESLKSIESGLADFKTQIGHDYLGVPALADNLVRLARGAGMGAAEASRFINSLSPEKLSEYADKFGVTEQELIGAADTALSELDRLGTGLNSLANNIAAAQAHIDATRASLAETDAALAEGLETLTGAAMSRLDDAVSAEKAALGEQLDARKTALDARLSDELAALDSAHAARIEALDAEKGRAEENLNRIRSIADALRGAMDSVVVESEQLTRARRQAAQAQLSVWARGGALPGGDALSDALKAVSGDSRQLFGTFEEYARSQGRTVGDIQSLAARAEAQVSNEERMVSALEWQRENLPAQYDAARLAAQEQHDSALAAEQEQHDAQIAEFEALKTSAVEQFNALLGIESGTLGVQAAVDNVGAALELYSSAISAGFAVQAETTATLQADIQAGIAERQSLSAQLSALEAAQIATSAAVADTAMQLQAGQAGLIGATGVIAKNEGDGSFSALAGGGQFKAPGFASGGDFAGGLRIVGEDGPELEVTGPARIFSASDTRNILSGDGDNSALIAEIRILRQSLESGQFAVAKNTGRAAKMLERWDGDGMPETRVVA